MSDPVQRGPEHLAPIVKLELAPEPVSEAEEDWPTRMAESQIAPAKRRSRVSLLKLASIAADFVVLVASIFLAALLADVVAPWAEGRRSHDTTIALVAVVPWMAIMARLRLYQARVVGSRRDEFHRLVKAVVFGCGAVVILDAVWDNEGLRRSWIGMLAVVSFVLLLVERELVRRAISRTRSRGQRIRNVAIIGVNDEAEELRRMIELDASLGYKFVGHMHVNGIRENGRADKVLGHVRNAVEIVDQHKIGHVLIAGSAVDLDTTKRLARAMLDQNVHVEISPTLPDIAHHRLTVRPFGRFPIMYLEPQRQDGWRAHAKRAFDTLSASAGLLALSPILALVAILVKLDSRGPIFFRQMRLGQHANEFGILKFRSMVVDAEERKADLAGVNEADGPLFKMTDDPRITRVGRFIRKTSLDELPQLWNVVVGDMSLVGPRPALASEAADWPEELRDRLRVKPGITGMWQVSGRSDTGFDEYSRLDLFYVDNWSLGTDLWILAKTVPAVVAGSGAS